MEVELDLWSSRSTDEVDHILSDVDCCDVPDVDEFILGCSSSVSCDLTKNDLTSSVDMDLSNHNLHNHHNDNHLNHHLIDETGVNDIHNHHLQGHQNHNNHHHQHHQHQHQHNQRQSASPCDATADECCDDLSSHNAASLTGLVDHLNEAPSHHRHLQQQSHLHQHHQHQRQQRQQHQIEFSAHLVNGSPSGVQYRQPAQHVGLSSASGGFQQQQVSNHQQIGGDSVASSANVYSAQQSTGVNGGQSSPASLMIDHQERLLNDSLIASRVDHCYILNDASNCQQQQQQLFDATTTSSSANQNQVQSPQANPFASQASVANSGRFVTSSGGAVTSTTTNSVGAQVTPGQLVDQHQLQMLLNSLPQAIGYQPAASIGTSSGEPLTGGCSSRASSGVKRRQTRGAGNKRTKKGAAATSGCAGEPNETANLAFTTSNNIKQVVADVWTNSRSPAAAPTTVSAATTTPTTTTTTTKTYKANLNAVSSSSRSTKATAGATSKTANASDSSQQLISTTRLNETSAGANKGRQVGRNNRRNKQQTEQQNDTLSGQVSPTLSSSGVSSLSSCSSSSSSSSSSSNSEPADTQLELCEHRLSLKLEPLISGGPNFVDESAKQGVASKTRRAASSRCQSPSTSSPACSPTTATARNIRRGAKNGSQISSSSSSLSSSKIGATTPNSPSKKPDANGTLVKVKLETGERQVNCEQQEPARLNKTQQGEKVCDREEQATGRLETQLLYPNDSIAPSEAGTNTKGESKYNHTR